MALKTFNIDEKIYKKFSDFCKEHGISMSKRIEIFIKSQMEDEPEVRPEYIKKLKRIEKEGEFISFNSVDELRKSMENA